MKYLLKVWDFFLLFFAFSTTKHCDKLDWDKYEESRCPVLEKNTDA